MASPKRVPVPPAKPATGGQGVPASPRRPVTRPGAADKIPPRPRPTLRKRITRDSTLRVLIAGASGMIGTELVRQLESSGHSVIRLVRREPRGADEVTWAPDAKILDFHVLEKIDAVVNLSGASLNRLPWTSSYREELVRSRIRPTQALVEAMAMASSPPQVFLSGSAVGLYGSRPGELLDDNAARGSGFLADLVEEWERAANLSPEKTRTVNLRTGVVIGPGGALGPLRLLTKFGLGGPLGDGTQHWPWVSLQDEAAAIVHLLTSPLSGPVNIAGPIPADSNAIGSRLAHNLHRPYRFRMPAKLIGLTLQDAGRELLLADQAVTPAKLLSDGFAFAHTTSNAAVDAYG